MITYDIFSELKILFTLNNIFSFNIYDFQKTNKLKLNKRKLLTFPILILGISIIFSNSLYDYYYDYLLKHRSNTDETSFINTCIIFCSFLIIHGIFLNNIIYGKKIFESFLKIQTLIRNIDINLTNIPKFTHCLIFFRTFMLLLFLYLSTIESMSYLPLTIVYFFGNYSAVLLESQFIVTLKLMKCIMEHVNETHLKQPDLKIMNNFSYEFCTISLQTNYIYGCLIMKIVVEFLELVYVLFIFIVYWDDWNIFYITMLIIWGTFGIYGTIIVIYYCVSFSGEVIINKITTLIY